MTNTPVPCQGVNHAIGDIGGFTPLIAACRNGNLERIDLSTARVTTSLPGSGFTFVGFTNDTHGVAISGTGFRPNGQPDLNDRLYLTHDSGKHWVQANL